MILMNYVVIPVTPISDGLSTFASELMRKAMSDLQPVVSRLLGQILSLRSPEPGARLKQRLQQAFVASGFGEFDEKSLGFSKFTEYLVRSHGDLVRVVRPEESGDVLVFLRGASDLSQLAQATFSSTSVDLPQRVRGDVWQAFVNPDPDRRRFFNKETGRVLHFLAGQGAPEQAEMESSPEAYVEITPISGDVQIGWMRDFLASQAIPDDKKAPLEAIVGGSYSSSVNAIFIRSLGKHAMAWRNYRITRVTEKIDGWAQAVGLGRDLLYTARRESTASIAQAVSSSLGDKKESTFGAGQLPPKQQVLKLLELLTDDDVSRLVIPTLLSTILIKSRM